MSIKVRADCFGAVNEKPRFPLSVALKVAEELAAELRPHCTRLEIAGSIRRKKDAVGDIELIYVPIQTEAPDIGSLFGGTIIMRKADAIIEGWCSSGVLTRRLNINGSQTYGEKIKLLHHAASGIPVDLFATTEESWFNYLVCRTGGAENNVEIASAAQQKGWQWRPYSPGFYRIGHTERMNSEREVFEFVGLPYLEPQWRK